MKKYRILAMSLAALLCVSSFASCGKEEKKAEKSEGASGSEAEILEPSVSGEQSESSEENDDEGLTDAQKETKKRANEIAKRAKSGEDFYSLVEEFGEDPGMENNPEGYFFTYGTMVAEFEQASFELEVGEISDPVKTPYGYHIIKKLPLGLEKDSTDYINIAYEVGSEQLLAIQDEYAKTLQVTYTDKFEDLTVLNMGTLKETDGESAAVVGLDSYDWKYDGSEIMFYVDTIPVTFDEYRYYAMGNKAYFDGGDDAYWTEENEESYKTELVEQFKRFIGAKLIANSDEYGITLSDEDYASIDTIIAEYKVQFGEEQFASILNEIFVDEATFRHMLEYDKYSEKLLLTLATEEDIMNYAEENYVRVQHILIAFPAES